MWKESLQVGPLVMVVQVGQAPVESVPAVVEYWSTVVAVVVEGRGYGTLIGSRAAG